MRAPVMLLLPLLLSAYPAIGKEATGLTMLGPCKSALHNGNARLSWYCVGAIDTIRLMGNFYRDEYAFCPKKECFNGRDDPRASPVHATPSANIAQEFRCDRDGFVSDEMAMRTRQEEARFEATASHFIELLRLRR
jgi:hypothetical protein